MAKSDKTGDEQLKGAKKTVTMRERIEGAQAKEDKKTAKKSEIVSKNSKNKKVVAKDVTKAKRDKDLEERGFLKSFVWGFTLPIRYIFKPIAWVLKRIVPSYFKNSWKELKQVTWPSTRDTFRLTFVVLLFSLVFGGLIAGVDYGLDKLFKAIILK